MKKSRKRWIALFILLLIVGAIAIGFRNTAREIVSQAAQAGIPTQVPNAEIKVAHADGTFDRYLVQPPFQVLTFVKTAGGAAMTLNAVVVNISPTDRITVSSYVLPPNLAQQGQLIDGIQWLTASNATP